MTTCQRSSFGRTDGPKLIYERAVHPRPRLGPYATRLEQLLEEDEPLPASERRRTMRLYEAPRSSVST